MSVGGRGSAEFTSVSASSCSLASRHMHLAFFGIFLLWTKVFCWKKVFLYNSNKKFSSGCLYLPTYLPVSHKKVREWSWPLYPVPGFRRLNVNSFYYFTKTGLTKSNYLRCLNKRHLIFFLLLIPLHFILFRHCYKTTAIRFYKFRFICLKNTGQLLQIARLLIAMLHAITFLLLFISALTWLTEWHHHLCVCIYKLHLVPFVH